MIQQALKAIIVICLCIAAPLQASRLHPLSALLVMNYLITEKEAANPTVSQEITRNRQSRNYQPEFYTYLTESLGKQLNRGFHHFRPHAITDVTTIFIYPGNRIPGKQEAKNFEERWAQLQKKWRELSGPSLPNQNTVHLRGHWEYDQNKTTQEASIKNLCIKTMVVCQQHELNSLLQDTENTTTQHPTLYKQLLSHYFATHADKPKKVDAYTTAQAEQFCQDPQYAALTSPFYVLTYTTVIPLEQLEKLCSKTIAGVENQHTHYHQQRRAHIKEQLTALNATLAEHA